MRQVRPHEIRFTHGGIAKEERGTFFVIEAIPDGVSKTPLTVFLDRSQKLSGKPIVSVGRLIKQYRPLIPCAIQRAERLLGAPYDFTFTANNGAYYCSELVSLAFLAPNDEPLFQPTPMSFRDSAGVLSDYWRDNYQSYGMSVPRRLTRHKPYSYDEVNRTSLDISLVYITA